MATVPELILDIDENITLRFYPSKLEQEDSQHGLSVVFDDSVEEIEVYIEPQQVEKLKKWLNQQF